jgi:hypothetical protein
LISTSNNASIDPKAEAIHHRTTNQAIHQKIIEKIRLVQENRIFGCCFFCNHAKISGIHKNAKGKTQRYKKFSEYLK